MEFRLAAALALVGWYLMIPPQAAVHAPLSQWNRVESYATNDLCESAKDFSIQMINHPASLGPDVPARVHQIGPARMTEIRQQVSASQCIASDDPSLKEN
jgi:hypothetical protein